MGDACQDPLEDLARFMARLAKILCGFTRFCVVSGMIWQDSFKELSSFLRIPAKNPDNMFSRCVPKPCKNLKDSMQESHEILARLSSRSW